jgi:hypothetical protein
MSKQLPAFEVEFSVENWLAEGRNLMQDVKALDSNTSAASRTHGALQWKIGDWLIYGEEEGKKKKVFRGTGFKRKACEITKYTWGSLKNMMTIARQVKESRRRDGLDGRKFLPYALHVEVAKFGDEKQEEYLAVAEKNKRYRSARELKKLIVRNEEWLRKMEFSRKQSRGEIPQTEVYNDGKGKVTVLNLKIDDREYELLKKLCAIKYGVSFGNAAVARKYVAKFLNWASSEYFKEHQADLDKMLADRDAADAALEKQRLENVARHKERTRQAIEFNGDTDFDYDPTTLPALKS